jgi:flagellin
MKGVDANRSHPKIAAAFMEGTKRGWRWRQQGIREGVRPMALGVLNNLSAIYAENNLNNTNNSLQTVLQQLSSGSRINSGADDAAGLSLVNGLGANSAALTQSETNATEGAGLLQVADGALSQVTNLLNRAITLATEASNGTLNSSQDAAANQEYQSILSEINNIGSTTTYNQESVFSGNTIAIYTGDSSMSGSSIDDLNIHPLSNANLGDSDGMMSYSNGQSNVFIDLSEGGVNASLTDALVNPTTTLDVSYLTTGAGGATTVSNTTISVGAGQADTNDTVNGLIDAINASGLGITASFVTGAEAGDTANGTDTGIEISGNGAGVGYGSTPGLEGTLASTGLATDDLSGTLTIKDSNGVTHTLNLGGAGLDTLQNIANTINGDGFGVSVTYDAATKSDTFTSASSKVSVSASGLGDATTPADVPTWTPSAGFYSVGVTNSGGGIAAPDIADTATGQTAAASASFVADPNGLGGIATMSYSDSAGTDLSGTSLSDQASSQTTLNLLNLAISDVAAQDGYIGAQINTLNAISQVMSTQQENVVSAQNAIQATDYASATSNMSKYEILSQTGIAALAQANQVQQEVTKLLQ